MSKNQIIPLEEAKEMTTNWRGMIETKTVPPIYAFKFDRDSINKLLSQPEVATIRAYIGAENEEVNSFLVGVNDKGEDLIELGIYNLTMPCPRSCDEKSPLLSPE